MIHKHSEETLKKVSEMWRGYTSDLLQKKSKQLIINKYEYELI
jgi:hypothetical protein